MDRTAARTRESLLAERTRLLAEIDETIVAPDPMT